MKIWVEEKRSVKILCRVKVLLFAKVELRPFHMRLVSKAVLSYLFLVNHVLFINPGPNLVKNQRIESQVSNSWRHFVSCGGHASDDYVPS